MYTSETKNLRNFLKKSAKKICDEKSTLVDKMGEDPAASDSDGKSF